MVRFHPFPLCLLVVSPLFFFSDPCCGVVISSSSPPSAVAPREAACVRHLYAFLDASPTNPGFLRSSSLSLRRATKMFFFFLGSFIHKENRCSIQLQFRNNRCSAVTTFLHDRPIQSSHLLIPQSQQFSISHTNSCLKKQKISPFS